MLLLIACAVAVSAATSFVLAAMLVVFEATMDAWAEMVSESAEIKPKSTGFAGCGKY